jgi:carboxypeptidase Q
MRHRSLPAVLVAGLAVALSAVAVADSAVQGRIRQEATERSQIMRTLHFLTDVYGPRVTGSPSLKAAGEWAVRTMEGWGLTSGRLEPWDWGRPGWVNERFSAHIISPVQDQLVAEVLAWTPGTSGLVRAAAFNLLLPDRPTAGELNNYLESVRAQVKGRIVLAGRHTPAPVNLNPPAKRRDDGQVRTQFEPGREAASPARRTDASANEPDRLSSGQVSRRVDEFLVESGAVIRVNDGRREHGQIIAFQNNTYDVTKVLPTVVMRNEDYGRIARILADGTPVDLEFDIVNRLFPEGRTAYNAVAEIEGTDLKDQVVMMGGHLDSWQSGTGATDNAIGCAAMMEAVRILKAIGVRPRRTIRVALWSGEEQGLLGSRAYVAQHFGSFEQPKPAYANLVAYLNMDTGTGRLRGATVFGPQEAATVLRSILAPFENLGVAGAISTRNRNTGGTDSTVFNHAGLPGVNFTQDPIEYDTHTHHTNLDTYERVLESDVKDAAVVLASTAYDLAMRDEMLPRFKPADMPAPAAR